MEFGVSASTASAASAKPSTGKKLWSVSPSQVDAYRRCPRIWYNGTVLKDREPSKPFQLRGEAIHKALEIYLRTGEVKPTISLPDPLKQGALTEFTTFEFIQVAIPHIPRPANDLAHWGQYPKDDRGAPTAMLLLEQAGELGTWDAETPDDKGPGVTQFIDVVEALPKTCRILDYKTTSNFRYAKTPEELQKNTQLCWNAKYIFAISDYEEIEIEHLYLLTTGRPKALPVRTRVTRAQVEEVWARDMALVREMVEWARLGPVSADVLPPHTDHCDDYGGCFYRTKCGFDNTTVPYGKRIPDMSDKPMGLLADILAQAKKGNPKSAVVASASAALKSGGDLMAVLGAKPAAAPAKPEVVFEAPTNTSPAFTGATAAADRLKDTLAAKRETTGILPPDAPPTTSTPEEVEAANVAKAEAEAEPKADEDAVEPTTTETKKPGRKKKQLQIELPADAPAAAPAATPGAALADAAPTVASPPAPVVEAQAQAAEALKNPLVNLADKERRREALDRTKTNEGAVPTEAPADVLNDIDKLRDMLRGPDPAFECGVEALFIDCMPQKGWPGEPAVDLAEVMHTFERVAAQSAKKPDYRLIDYQATGFLAQSIRVLMKGLPRTVYLDSRMPGALVFLAVVTPYCKLIVKGQR